MYTEFYGLTKKPFNMTPDPAFLFLTKQHREALAGMTYAILARKGFVQLSGSAGSGKTTLLAWVLQKLPRDQTQSSVILHPTLTKDEFLELALLDFGIPEVPASKAQRLWVLQKFLLKGKTEGKVNVLIVDEAHKLSTEVLEEIRLLGNLEYAEEKLLQVLLIGQSELDDLLARPELWQFKQRISVRLSLNALSASDVEHYIQHRWTVAGGRMPLPFSSIAISNAARWSKGIPRLINSICDNALMLAFAEEASCVSSEHIDSSAGDLRLIDRPVTKVVPLPVAADIPSAPIVVQPPLVRAVERREPRRPKKSALGRWVEKLGFGG